MLDATWVLEDNEEKLNQGTVFALSGYGLVTCCHVPSPKTKAFRRNEYAKRKYSVEIEKSDDELDLAILKIDRELVNTHRKGDSDKAKIGDSVILAGYPNYQNGDSGGYAEGKIVGMRGEGKSRLFLIDAPIIRGNSGGPVLDENGMVIGVAVTGADSVEDGQDTEKHGVIPINLLDKF